MDSLQAIILAFVQGITEFLPVSSSGHLVLVPKLLGWEDQGLAFDVAAHVGSLLAVLLYFRREVMLIVNDTTHNLFGGAGTENSRLGWQIVFATIPVGLAGLLMGDWVETTLRAPENIAYAAIIFALILWWVDKHNRQARDIKALNWKDILVIGIAQAVALIPGVSRSGMTITAALLMGLKRDDAARFSFLMAIPVIVLAGGLKALELLKTELPIDWGILGLGVGVSAVVAFACIHWFLGFIKRFSMVPFSLYLLALGAFTLYVFR
ncbi:MAG: undecaprenyl-diphosphate phosphatase [Arenicellales bacterium]